MDLPKIHFYRGNTKESESLRTYRFIYKMKQNLQSMRPQTLYYILKDIQTKENSKPKGEIMKSSFPSLFTRIKYSLSRN